MFLSQWCNYRKDDKAYVPDINVFGRWLLYKIVDKKYGLYIGITHYDRKLTVQQNLERRMKEHCDPNSKSQVLKMDRPKIKPYYPNIDGYPCFIYGTQKQVEAIENKHINKTVLECQKKKRKCYNIRGVIKPPKKPSKKQLKEINVVDNEIERLIREFKIQKYTYDNGKTEKTKYVINSRKFADAMNSGGDQMTFSDIQDAIHWQIKGIAKCCCDDPKNVKKIRKQMIQKCKEKTKKKN